MGGSSDKTKAIFQANPDDPRHGTSNGYTNLACRCETCRRAWSESRPQRRTRSNVVVDWPTPRRGRMASKQHLNTDWMELAECRGIDPELFHPHRGESTLEAKAICRGCPVRVECLDYALTPPVEKNGVWGGLAERERRRIRTQRRRAS